MHSSTFLQAMIIYSCTIKNTPTCPSYQHYPTIQDANKVKIRVLLLVIPTTVLQSVVNDASSIMVISSKQPSSLLYREPLSPVYITSSQFHIQQKNKAALVDVLKSLCACFILPDCCFVSQLSADRTYTLIPMMTMCGDICTHEHTTVF